MTTDKADAAEGQGAAMRPPWSLSLHREVVTRIDDLAKRHNRSRSGMAETLLRHALGMLDTTDPFGDGGKDTP